MNGRQRERKSKSFIKNVLKEYEKELFGCSWLLCMINLCCFSCNFNFSLSSFYQVKWNGWKLKFLILFTNTHTHTQKIYLTKSFKPIFVPSYFKKQKVNHLIWIKTNRATLQNPSMNYQIQVINEVITNRSEFKNIKKKEKLKKQKNKMK